MGDTEINPWGSESVKDYGKLSKEFGIENFGKFAGKLPEPLLYMKRNIIFGHRDFGKVAECIRRKKPFVMMTGLMPSGKFHIGHKMLADQIIYYQKHGAEIFLCVADIEAYNMRLAGLEQLRKIAIEEYLLNYIALGLTPKKCDFYFQSGRSADAKKSNAFYRLAGTVPKRVTMNEMKAIYGDLSPGKIMSVMVQVADILHPQMEEFGGPRPVLVPVGIDQDPHLRLTRDIAARMKGNGEFDFVLPSSTYHEFMKGLKGGKMSSSDPYSYIALTDDPKIVKDKIMKYAFSGGRETIKEHREKGGDPGIDVAYHMLEFMFEPDDRKLRKLHSDYKSGALLTGELKQILIERVQSFLEQHQKKREAAKKQVDKFLK